MQTNRQAGIGAESRVSFPAGEDLSSSDDRLAVLTHDTGAAEVKLPSAIGNLTPFIIIDGGKDGEPTTLEPLSPGQNVRIPLKGTVSPGEEVVMADPGTAADKGKIRKLPASAGTYKVVAIAEESGVDGQTTLVRPVGPYDKVVSP